MFVAICEDNPIESQAIADIVGSAFGSNGISCNISQFNCAKDFESSAIKYDLIFMDCKLPDGNGIEIAHRLRETDDEAVIIYVTAYGEYVFDSFEVGAFRYILKPVKEDAIKKAIESFIKYSEKNSYIDIPTAHKAQTVRLTNIIYVEANNKRSIVRLADRTIDSTKTISSFQDEIISPAFFRTHRHFLLNMKYIADINNNVIILTNGEKVEVSRRCLADFNKAYTKYIKYSIKNGK